MVVEHIMEEQSTNNDSSNGHFSFGISTSSQRDATNAITLSLEEIQQLYSDSPISYREMLEDNYDTNNNNDSNVSHAPPISSSSSTVANYDRNFLTAPNCANCGLKRRRPDEASQNNEASHHSTEDCHCEVTLEQSINPSDPSISQGPSHLGEDTSGEGNSNLSSCPVGNYRNARSRRKPENVTRRIPPLHNTSQFIHLTSRSSINEHGEVTHNMEAPRFSSILGISDGIPNSSNEVAPMTRAQHTGTSSNQYISLFGQIITQPIRPVNNAIIGSNMEVQDTGSLTRINIGSNNEGSRGNIYNISEANHSRIIQNVTEPQRRELIAMAQALRTGSSRRDTRRLGSSFQAQLHQAFPGYTRETVHLALEIANLTNEIRVNTPLSDEDILQGLNVRRYCSSTRNDEEEQEMCCICLHYYASPPPQLHIPELGITRNLPLVAILAPTDHGSQSSSFNEL
ncbi:hypothetical protein ACH5RR_018072 [Cinchona calisaya]|uniref:Uncharacterized protein n=1 Tax=Cinchona calisaya TaxID=153742 RepID=A0ABD2ZLQ1_9GENT